MANINASIYQNLKGPDIVGGLTEGYERGLKMSDMLQKRQADRAEQERQAKVNQVLSQNMTVNEKGIPSLNPAAMSQLAGIARPDELMQLGSQFQEQQKAQAMEAEKKLTQGLNLVQSVLLSDKPEQIYGAARNQILALGVDPAEVPEKYDAQALNMIVQKYTPYKEQVANYLKQQESGLEQQVKKSQIAKNYAEAAKTSAEKKSILEKPIEAKVTQNQKLVDKDYVKDYNDFLGGGQRKAINSINKLRDYQKVLEEESSKIIQAGGGNISGSLPDMFRTEKSIKIRDDIQSVANQALKAIFGGTGITDSERKALAAEFYNDKLGPKDNLEILNRKLEELESSLSDSMKRAEYFQRNKTLEGFEVPVIAPKETQRTQMKVPKELNDAPVDLIQQELERRRKNNG